MSALAACGAFFYRFNFVMSHKSNAFAGDFLPYSRNLASWGFAQLCATGSRASFVSSFDGVPCVVVPHIEADKITISVFYGAKRTLSVARLVGYPIEEIIRDWRRYCRAFVVAEMSPRLTALDHHGTRNAAVELKCPERWVRMPTLRELDSALNTSLEALENELGGLLLLKDIVDVHDQRCR